MGHIADVELSGETLSGADFLRGIVAARAAD
jgi:hypothetical protein